ncbi:hypothetical protein BDZ88DRAFT_434322 [Geranomyces variabilis]|nr:hypothetical protein BDZ88DRAFT_434322 [Geranomyces variabilis]KAJ3133188.1 hypothetical protein HDU90_006343 [Geranomyces variabilis]
MHIPKDRLLRCLACIAVLAGIASAATPLPGAPHVIDYLNSPICAGPSDSAWSAGRDQLAQSAQLAASDVVQIDMARLLTCDSSSDRALAISQQIGAYIGNTRQARNLLCDVTELPTSDTQLQRFTDFVSNVAAAESQLQILLQAARQDPQCQAWVGRSQPAPPST